MSLGQSFEFEKQTSPTLGGELLFVEDAKELLPSDFLDEVVACLTFDNPSLTPINAMGRSYFVSLPDSDGPYNALQISGGGYVDHGIRSLRDQSGLLRLQKSQVIEPLRANFEEFESGGTSFVDDEGKVQVVYSKGILGTYSGSQADLKVQKTHEVWKRLDGEGGDLLVPRVIGRFVFNLPDGKGGAQTAVLMLVPNNGLRMDHDLNAVEIELFSLLDARSQKDRAKEILRKELPAKIQTLGFGLAKIHDLGYSHNQTHLGNLATVKNQDGKAVPFIADWDTSRLPIEAVRSQAQTVDFAQLVISLMRWLQHLETMVETPSFWGTAKALGNSVLHGYAAYYGHDDPSSLKIPAGEMVEHAYGRYDTEDMIEFFGGVVSMAKASN